MIIKIIDDQQLNINSIDELFYHLYHIEKLTVFSVKKFILESEWSSTTEKMQELAASILQVVKSYFLLHHIILDLLNELEIECDKMKFLIQFIVEKLMNSFGESKQNCSFIYLLKSLKWKTY